MIMNDDRATGSGDEPAGSGRLARLRKWLAEGPRGGNLVEELPRLFPLFLLLFGLGMILISLVGDQGLIAYYRLQKEAETLRLELQTMQGREQELLREIDALNNSDAYLEMLARRNLGLVKPDEMIIQLPPAKGGGPQKDMGN